MEEELMVFKDRVEPSKTFNLIYETNRISGFCDGLDALKQTIYCRLLIPKDKFPIYHYTYGSELETLIGEPIYFAIPKIEYFIKDTLLEDDRITDVIDFEHEVDSHTIHSTFTVVSNLGNVEAESVVNI